jgi:hypothetical protein
LLSECLIHKTIRSRALIEELRLTAYFLFTVCKAILTIRGPIKTQAAPALPVNGGLSSKADLRRRQTNRPSFQRDPHPLMSFGRLISCRGVSHTLELSHLAMIPKSPNCLRGLQPRSTYFPTVRIFFLAWRIVGSRIQTARLYSSSIA